MIDFPKQKIVVAGAGRSRIIFIIGCYDFFFLIIGYFLFDVNLA